MSDEDKRYNGWGNYETWLVNLWIDNEPIWLDTAEETARECAALNMQEESPMLADYYTDPIKAARGRVITLADRLKEWFEEETPDTGASLWADLLGAALAQVQWTEIAEHLMDEVQGAV